MGIQLPTKPLLTTDAARQIADAAAEEARNQNLRMSIIVVDEGGIPLFYVRMSEQIAAGTFDAAFAKAKSAIIFKRATLAWEEAAAERPVIFKLPNVMPVGGGVPLLVNGMGIGAIGVSGATSAKDDEIARAGAKILE